MAVLYEMVESAELASLLNFAHNALHWPRCWDLRRAVQEVSMINVTLPRPMVRLLIDRALHAQLVEMDEDRYEVLREAMRFAEDAISIRLTAEGELPQFLVPFDTLELAIVFCRTRERFVVRAIIELGDDTPPPGASLPPPSETAAESLLRAAGIEVRPPRDDAMFLSPGEVGDSSGLGVLPVTGSAIRVAGDPAALGVILALGRHGLSGPFVTLTPAAAADAAATCTRFCATANTSPASSTPAATADGDGAPPVPWNARASGTSTDP